MFFLKFLSFVSLSLLFMGNVAAAECVDLSGTYSCEGEIMTLTKTSNKEGLYAYSATRYGVENPILPVFDESAGQVTLTTTCTENQIETKLESSNDGTLTASFIFLNEQTLAMRFTLVDLNGRSSIDEGAFCNKQ